MKTMAAGRRSRSQNTAAKDPIKSLKPQLSDAQWAHEKLANESFRTKADLRGKVAAVEKSLGAGKTRVARLNRELATEAEKRQQLLAERRRLSQAASCPLVEDEDFFRELQ